jgi:hypothetical protein
MSRSTLLETYRRHLQVKSLDTEGWKVADIQTKLGFKTRMSVYCYLQKPLPALNPFDLLERAWVLRNEHEDLSPSRILDMVAQEYGFSRAEPPFSVTWLQREFHQRGYTRLKGLARLPEVAWWPQESRKFDRKEV